MGANELREFLTIVGVTYSRIAPASPNAPGGSGKGGVVKKSNPENGATIGFGERCPDL